MARSSTTRTADTTVVDLIDLVTKGYKVDKPDPRAEAAVRDIA